MPTSNSTTPKTTLPSGTITGVMIVRVCEHFQILSLELPGTATRASRPSFWTLTSGPRQRTPCIHRRLSRSLALPEMRWTDEGHRKAHRCRNPTSFSSYGHGCGMKRLSLTRNFPASINAPDFYALRPHKSLLAASSTTLFRVLFRSTQLLSPWCRVWLSELQPPRTPHRSSTRLNLHNPRVRRKQSGSLEGFIGRARRLLPAFTPPRGRASDTALTLIGT
jgi:hypothetical protein